MYEAITSSLELWQLIVAAVICHGLGDRARRVSLAAKNWGIPLGLLVACLVTAEGWLSSRMEFAEFIRLDLLRIGVMAALVVGVTSVCVKFAEPLVNGANHQRKTMAERARRKQEEAERARNAEVAAERWEAERPQREAQHREFTERKHKEEQDKQLAAKRKREHDRRRETARQRLLLTYHKHSPKIQEAIHWERLQEYMATFMNDNKPADQVEESASRMVEAIESHFKPAVKKQARKTVAQIAAEFDIRRQEIENSPLSDAQRAAHLADLEMQLSLAMGRSA